MKNLLKKSFALLLAAVICLSPTACSSKEEPDDPVVGNDWRVTGVVRDSGTITRGGEDTAVLVCVHASDAAFYLDTEDQELFAAVNYPLTLESDAWEAFQSIDFADRNGDGNSDVAMKFHDGGSELLMVWFWDAESKAFAYQPDESQLGEDEGQGDLIPEEDGQGDLIPEDDGQGDLIPEDEYGVAVLMGGELPFTNMENLAAETYEDGTYYYEDMAEDGTTIVVNTVLPRDFADDEQTTEDYLIGCALDLADTDSWSLESVEQNEAYTMNMSFPVYIVTYIAGENEDSREWTVFAMDTDLYTYLYGFGTMLDEAENVKSVYPDVFAGLYMSDGE